MTNQEMIYKLREVVHDLMAALNSTENDAVYAFYDDHGQKYNGPYADMVRARMVMKKTVLVDKETEI